MKLFWSLYCKLWTHSKQHSAHKSSIFTKNFEPFVCWARTIKMYYRFRCTKSNLTILSLGSLGSAWPRRSFLSVAHTLHKKMKFSIKDFSSKCGQTRRKLRIWSHLLKKSLIENFIICAVIALDRDMPETWNLVQRTCTMRSEEI